MKRCSAFLSAFVAVFCLAGCAAAAEHVRPAAVAGMFYPSDVKELTSTVDGLLAGAHVAPISEPIVAVVAPHAGYPYSGPVAAYTYAALKGRKYERVVVIAPSHYEAFPFNSIYDGDAYVTPLGAVKVDHAFASKLVAASPLIQFSSRGHTPSAERGEHSLEVELPFLQRALGDFKLVPIIMGDQSYEASRALGVALAKLVQPNDTLIVASSDLSHYHPYDTAVQLDHKVLQAVEDWDYLNLSRNLEARVWEACGGGPIVAAMIAAERLGATEARLLKYANSGDTTSIKDRVVGYSSFAFVRAASPRGETHPAFSLTAKEKQELLGIARKAVETAIRERRPYEPPEPASAALREDRGAFVTLTKNGDLRGCIGYPAPNKPLYLTVRDVAMLAALRDTRFPPVANWELGSLSYEVSVLSPFRRMRDPKEVQVGKVGLVIRKGGNEGFLLPQVPVEQHWDRATFLEQVGVKAGLPRSAWKDADADVFTYTALVFGEHQPSAEEALPPTPAKPGPPGRDLPPR